MADPKSNDAPASAAKPAGTSGAVKPPVLEGKAQPVAEPAAAAAAKANEPVDKPAETSKKPPHSKPGPAPVAAGSGGRLGLSPWLAGLVGGAIGLGAAYGLAAAGYWPAHVLPAPPADSRVDDLMASVPEVRTIADTTQSELARLTARVATLEAAEPAPASPDLSSALADLEARLDTLESADPVSAADASANAGAIVSLQADVTALQDRAGSFATAIEDLTDRLGTLSQSMAEAGSDENAVVRLPLVISGLEAAFTSGQPFAAELDALTRIRPEAEVPAALAAAAATGLPAPDAVGEQLQGVLPAMLAARPAGPDSGWQGATADWFRSILALRPSGPIEGEGPDATLARLEDAVSRRDFTAAEAAFAALPAPMQEAAGTIGTDVSVLAAARQFLVDLRQSALAEGTTP